MADSLEPIDDHAVIAICGPILGWTIASVGVAWPDQQETGVGYRIPAVSKVSGESPDAPSRLWNGRSLARSR
jgi:hypothetical protein